ncbi:sulfur oxidation c-type cytochrome SoxX [Roseibium denhamense]|uniref:Monoheme cytochrome SoxX (Sulfur oxidation) n=1 Tax=Roseibium denhamense TaxID=76305 RepID=A0ABY1NXN1_9HYPH|nr:sulfur oxidation c-type cytochrome SoxX [Roseibium denhamense]MTI04902.1 sulfur oxidation c-type cytochrome SoxX [Roseibium denhamense]SMP20684.1 monoheme cytochrome SoxX (sulfur oxidation) [Roseibium denhamense]
MRHALFGLAACVAASSVSAAEIQPADVVFVDGAIEASLSGGAGDPASGAEIMDKGAGNCIACHQVSALSHLSFHGEIGPPLDGVADRWSEAEIRGIVANAKVMFEGSMMPSFYKTEGFVRLGDAYTGDAHGDGDVQPLLTAQQVEDVVAFLLTLNEQ